MGIKFSYSDNASSEGVVDFIYPVNTLKDVYDFVYDKCNNTPQNTDKNKLHRFIPSCFDPKNPRRHSDAFLGANIIGLDLDKETEENFEKFVLGLAEKGTGFFFYETPTSSAQQKKYRIVFELSKPITDIKTFKKVYEVLFKDKINYDKSCNDPTKFFYISNCSKLDSFTFVEGSPLIVPDIPQEKDTPKLTDDEMSAFFKSTKDEETVIQIINFLKTEDKNIIENYETWRSICFACVSLKNNDVPKEKCLQYFKEISSQDKKDYSENENQIAVEDQFERCWKSTRNEINIGTIVMLAKNKGYAPKKENKKNLETVKIVKVVGKDRYHLAYENSPEDDLVDLAPETRINSETRAEVEHEEKYALKWLTDVKYWKEHEGRPPTLEYKDKIDTFITKFTRHHPNKTYFLLGSDREGVQYEKSTNSILISKHHRVPCKAVFHKEIDDFIKQLHCTTAWFYSYMYHFTNMKRAMPFLYLYGHNNTGKSTLIKCFASVYNTEPITKYFKDGGGGFVNRAGMSPVIYFDEGLPNKVNDIKSIITEYCNDVDQKYETALVVRGYSRLMFANNNDDFSFPPTSSDSDNGALLRRVQPIHFSEANEKYIEGIGGYDVLITWKESGKFREHLKYVQENPQQFNILPNSKDVIVLKPDVKPNKSGTFTKTHQRIMEHFYVNWCKPPKDVRNKWCKVPQHDFMQDLVVKQRLLSNSISNKELVKILNRQLAGTRHRVQSKNIKEQRYWVVERDAVLDVLKTDYSNEEIIYSDEIEKEENFKDMETYL